MPHRRLPAAIWSALRPYQWVKNVIVFGGLAFTGRWHRHGGGAHVDIPHAAAYALAAFVIFCLLSSAGYLINDVKDIEADRQHPEKRRRAIASGQLSVGLATVIAIVLFAIAMVGAAALSMRPRTEHFLLTVVTYAVLTNWYSMQLKRFVIIDALSIAALFVMRAIAGCWVIPEPPSKWIVACTFFGALFIALCKRRAELVAESDTGDTRAVLRKYRTAQGDGANLLDSMVQMAGTATILTYALYTFNRPAELGLEREQGRLMLTIPFVVYGVFRYLYLVHKADIGQNPEKLFSDRAMIINLVLWVVAMLAATYER
jgi:4-hydroxybenzoate polyprenyltransferase